MQLCKETMINSYNGISFYGERRGAEDFNYYTELLASDLESLGENTGNYKEKFISKVMNIYHKQASCTSSFIVGPANYNIRRHNKTQASYEKAWQDFEHWRSRYFKAVNRVRTPSPETEIENAIADIDRLTNLRDTMKEANKLIKKYLNKDSEKLNSELLDLLKDQTRIDNLLTPDFANRIGFPSYQITSLTTRIRERKKKIETMKARIEAKENHKTIYFAGGSIYIENDRVIIAHDEKPEREIIDAIKKNGFRWSPKMGNWCRKHTANARYHADYLLNNFFGGQIVN